MVVGALLRLLGCEAKVSEAGATGTLAHDDGGDGDDEVLSFSCCHCSARFHSTYFNGNPTCLECMAFYQNLPWSTIGVGLRIHDTD